MKAIALATLVALTTTGCIPLIVDSVHDSAQTNRAVEMQRQSDARYMEIEKRLAALEAQRDGGK